jgi:hypothetical protein
MYFPVFVCVYVRVCAKSIWFWLRWTEHLSISLLFPLPIPNPYLVPFVSLWSLSYSGNFLLHFLKLTQSVVEQPLQIFIQIKQEQVGIAFFYPRPVTHFWPLALSSLSHNDKQAAVCFCLHKRYLYWSDIWGRVEAEGNRGKRGFWIKSMGPSEICRNQRREREPGGKVTHPLPAENQGKSHTKRNFVRNSLFHFVSPVSF